jgi:hypothetical protein
VLAKGELEALGGKWEDLMVRMKTIICEKLIFRISVYTHAE